MDGVILVIIVMKVLSHIEGFPPFAFYDGIVKCLGQGRDIDLK